MAACRPSIEAGSAGGDSPGQFTVAAVERAILSRVSFPDLACEMDFILDHHQNTPAGSLRTARDRHRVE